MADYGNSTDLGYLLTSISTSVSANQKSYALEIATTWVNSYNITGLTTASVPDIVEKAATFYAYAFLLRMLYDTSFDDSASAKWYETEAIRLMESYSAIHADEDALTNPYASSLSPGYVYSGRNKRTSYDDTDYDDVDETVWTSDD